MNFIQGKENVVVDALSRWRHELSAVILGVDLRSQILSALPLDGWNQEVRTEVESVRALEGRFARYSLESDGLLRNLGHIYVPSTGDLCTLIMPKAH